MACLFESEDEKRCAVCRAAPRRAAPVCRPHACSACAADVLLSSSPPQKLFAKVADLWCSSLGAMLDAEGMGAFDSLGQALVRPRCVCACGCAVWLVDPAACCAATLAWRALNARSPPLPTPQSSEAYQHCQALEEYFAEGRQPELGQRALAQVHLSRALIHALRNDAALAHVRSQGLALRDRGTRAPRAFRRRPADHVRAPPTGTPEPGAGRRGDGQRAGERRPPPAGAAISANAGPGRPLAPGRRERDCATCSE